MTYQKRIVGISEAIAVDYLKGRGIICRIVGIIEGQIALMGKPK